jgi:hypothetical protein
MNKTQKGEGYKMMQKVIDLAKNIHSPICLWTDSEKNVQYFERYGFKNHGKLGENDDYMMVFQ